MSSNPFRRKQGDGTPSASVRTSLDIDQERLQQVAQQAFADGDDVLQPTGTSGTTTQQEPPPPSLTTEVIAEQPATPPRSRENSTGSSPKRDVAGPPESERRRSLQADRAAESPPRPSLSSGTTTPSQGRDLDAASIPPPNRPLAPPAPPRPRRSVKRPRDEPRGEAPEEKTVVEKIVVTAEAPPKPSKADDPFGEWKVISAKSGIEDDSSKASTVKDDSGWETVEAVVESEESEYEEGSLSEASEPRTVSSVSFISKLSALTSEPEEMEPPALVQPPNPFRKKDDNEALTIRPQSPEHEKPDNVPPPVRFGIQNTINPQGPKAFRQSLDVNAFKQLMLTGQAAHTPEPMAAAEVNNLLKQSLPEGAERSYTPRSSQDTGRGGYDAEDPEQGKQVPPVTPPQPKAKPPPPKPRGQRNSMMMPPPQYRPETQTTPLKENSDPVKSQETPASPPKTPKPPPPLSRRMSVQIAPSSDGALSLQSTLQPAPPPPPPSRRPASSPKAQPTTPPGQPQELPSQLSLNISPLQSKKPAPPPARRASKRMSMPPGQLQAYSQGVAVSINNPSKNPSIPAPPPPPVRKKSQLSHPAKEGATDAEPQPRSSSSFDILDDLTKLQKEVDELLGRV